MLLLSLYLVLGLSLAYLLHYMLDQDILSESRIASWGGMLIVVALVFAVPFLIYIMLANLYAYVVRLIDDISLDDYGC